ncbi:MAG: hypothetical protein RLZZ324_627 [Candidatus Parcubacteria bacterium]|jgi:DNA processing protein
MYDAITVIPQRDPRYPPLLRHIPDPPRQLYVRGRAELLARADHVAAVGTRKMTRYGEEATHALVGPLAAAGIPIVSGLALGVDAAAHEAALASHGATIAVLAGGIPDEDVTPPANLGLARRILASGGAIISEYPPRTPSWKGQFLARNRIVCGMSRATLIVEAPLRSGALFTARMALEQGRDVFAVPGPITSDASQGTNKLISEGAAPALNAEFILHALGYALPGAGTRSTGAPLTQEECAVLDALSRGLRDPDEIAAQTALPARNVAAALSSLALKGSIRN